MAPRQRRDVTTMPSELQMLPAGSVPAVVKVAESTAVEKLERIGWRILVGFPCSGALRIHSGVSGVRDGAWRTGALGAGR